MRRAVLVDGVPASGKGTAARGIAQRPGRLGLGYVPELRELAARAAPTGLGALLDADTSQPTPWDALMAAVVAASPSGAA